MDTKRFTPFYIVIFFVSLSSIQFEICLTRIFSLVFSYHFVFLSLSLAMCGLGIGGFLATKKNFNEGNLLIILFLLGFSYPLSILVPLKITSVLSHPLLLALPSMAPFILTGLFLALCYRFFFVQSGFIYFADLLGAGLGSLTMFPVLLLVSPINAIFVFALLVFISILINFKKPSSVLFILLIPLFVILNRNHRLLDIPYKNLPDIRDTKEMVRVIKDTKAVIEKTYWNPSFRTDVIFEPGSPNAKVIYVDGGTPTLMLRFDGNLNSLDWLKKNINYLPFLISEKRELLSIGPGGGLDILLGLLAGFEKIDGIEINGDILKILEEYKEFNGHITDLTSVRFMVKEGRNYLKSVNKSYDLIYLALAQTATSSKTGLPLVESYLHTTEAYQDYLSHLKSKGIIAFICEQSFFLQRTVFNVILALNRTGVAIKESKNNLIIVSNPTPNSAYRYLLILRREPFKPEEAEAILKKIRTVELTPRFLPYIYEEMPVVFNSLDEISGYIKETQVRGQTDISPTTDEKPFFYDLSYVAPRFLYWLCLATLLTALLSLFFMKKRASFKFIPLFSLLGIGFMLIEVSLTQKFLFFLGLPMKAFTILFFSILLGCGIGGFLIEKMKYQIKFLKISIAVLGSTLFILFLSLTQLLSHLLYLNDFSRACVSFVILFPVGIMLGMPFPFLMKKSGEISSRDTGLMCAVNGLMSVFGSSLCMIISKNLGFKYSILAAALIYLTLSILISKLFKE